MSKANLENFEPWKESLLRLPESKFLNIVRLYIGVIKTPYNKERLVGDLVSFLFKEDHKIAIVSLLSEKDIHFLSAIYYLENPSSEVILEFFGGEFSTFYLYDYLSNLEERLLVYRHFDDRSKKEYLEINPLLKEKIRGLLSLSVLLPLAIKENDIKKREKTPCLTEDLFASWYAFISEYPDACRANGTFKKKVLVALEKVFYGVSKEYLETMNTAFVNLGLFSYDGPNLYPCEKKWESFSQLSFDLQKMYICIASFRRFSRDAMTKNVSFAKNLLDTIPKEGFTKEVLYRLSFLLQNTKKEFQVDQSSGFFAKVLQRAQSNSTEEGFSEKALIEKMVFFNILKVAGKDTRGKEIFCSNNNLKGKDAGIEEKPFISINAGFSVTFLASVPLGTMLQLVKFMNIVNFDTVCQFEITRSSCMRSFDKGEGKEKILTLLEKASGKALTQNLAFSIKEWYETYNSASLYHGYVLQVSQEKIVQVENNTVLAQRIKKTLAPGIYIFDFETKEEMMEAVEKSSLDFIGSPKHNYNENDTLPFVSVYHKTELELEYSHTIDNREALTLDHLIKMKEELEKLHLPKEQKEGLQERIDRKLIVSEKQLIGETVRSEKTEASGIDFMGKIQVIDQAIAASNMLEITTAASIYTGRPLKIEKKEGDASVMLVQEDNKTITLLIGQARNVKRFRQPLF